MWRSDDGVLHTVALPDPAQVFDNEQVLRLLAVRGRRRRRLRKVVEDMIDEFYAGPHLSDPITEASFVGQSPPEGLVLGELHTEELLRAAVMGVPVRWRLDALVALEDLIR